MLFYLSCFFLVVVLWFELAKHFHQASPQNEQKCSLLKSWSDE